METLNKKIKNEDELLGLFIDVDGILSNTWLPFLHPTYNEVWATDGHVIIRIPPERLNKQYKPTDGCERLKLPTVEHPCSKSCTLAAIKQALEACPLVDEVETEEYEEKCEECDGMDVYGRREGAEPVTDVYHEKIYDDDGWNTGIERNLILTNETNW